MQQRPRCNRVTAFRGGGTATVLDRDIHPEGTKTKRGEMQFSPALRVIVPSW